MSRFIRVNKKGEEWFTLVNLDYLISVQPFDLGKRAGAGSVLTLAPNGEKMVVLEDFESISKLLEARGA